MVYRQKNQFLLMKLGYLDHHRVKSHGYPDYNRVLHLRRYAQIKTLHHQKDKKYKISEAEMITQKLCLSCNLRQLLYSTLFGGCFGLHSKHVEQGPLQSSSALYYRSVPDPVSSIRKS